MRIFLLAAAVAFSTHALASVRTEVAYYGNQDGSFCYFKIAKDLQNLTFQASGDYVVLGSTGVRTSANTAKFEGTVYFDYGSQKRRYARISDWNPLLARVPVPRAAPVTSRSHNRPQTQKR